MSQINVYSEAKKIFCSKDPREMAKNSGSRFDNSSNVFNLDYMGNSVRVKYPDGQIITENWELVKNDVVLILQYLTSSCGARPRETWIPFLQLPDGPHHHIPLVNEALNPLAEKFGQEPELFRLKLREFNAVEIKMGHIGGVIPVFPLLPLAICMWEGDDEFPAKFNILFDMTASLHLSTASLWVLAVELSRKLRNVVGQQFVNTNLE